MNKITIEKLHNDMVDALKTKDKFRKNVLSNLIAAVKKVGIDEKCRDNIPEELVNKVLIKEQKSAQEMIDTCPENRKDLLTEYQNKMEIIKEYAPQLISDENEIKKIIDANLPDNIEKNKKNFMKVLIPILKNFQVDMKEANKIIDKLVNS